MLLEHVELSMAATAVRLPIVDFAVQDRAMLRDDRDERVSAIELRRACAELERRLSAGEACGAEAIFEAHPELRDDSDAALEVVYTEFVAREQLGQQPTPADFYARFPQWREGLDQLFQIHAIVGTNSTLIAGARSDTPFPDAGHGLSVADSTDAPRQIGNYELLGEIGRGGMGVVYKARQLGLNRLVALKMILTGVDAGPQERARFRNEAEAVARLHHPNIVQIHEIGEHGGRPFLSLEYCDGGSLDDALTGAPWPAVESARLVETLARAMHHAHQQGIVHRDLKPANILLQRAEIRGQRSEVGSQRPEPASDLCSLSSDLCSLNSDFCPKIADFGLAQRLAAGATGGDGTGTTRSGAIVGTPAYMAPEQAASDRAEIGPATDIYALGTILFELLTGRPPFQGVSVLDTLEQVRTREPLSPGRLLPGLPRDLETICLKCLRKEPGQRYESAAALADDLGRFLRGEPVRARPTPAREKAWKWAKRRPAVAALLAALVVAVAGGLAGVTFLWRQTAASLDREREQKNQLEAALASKLVALAQRDWLADDLVSARRHLDECPPAHRGPEWCKLHYVCNACQVILGEAGPPGNVTALAWSLDGRRLASVQNSQAFRVWDLESGREGFKGKIEPSGFSRIGFDAEGRLVSLGISPADFPATAKTDKRLDLRIWNVTTERLVREFRGMPTTDRVAFSGDVKCVAAAIPEAITLYDVGSGTRVATLPHRLASNITALALNADGGQVALIVESKAAQVWDTKSGKLLLRVPATVGAIPLFSPDGEHLVLVKCERPAFDTFVEVWNLRNGKMLHRFHVHRSLVVAVAYSPDGCCLALVSADHSVKVCDPNSGTELFTFRGHTAPVTAAAFSPDSRRLATGATDGTVRIWNARPLEATID
jgi:eukaryotic-like serine/threonine-protein kinase